MLQLSHARCRLSATSVISRDHVITNWQRKLKDSTAGRICFRPEPSSVGFDNRTADRQAHSQALRFLVVFCRAICFGWRLRLTRQLISPSSAASTTAILLEREHHDSEIARVGLGFGMEVIAWSQNLTPEKAEAQGVRLASKDELFQQADIPTIHPMLSPRTRGLVGQPSLRP